MTQTSLGTRLINNEQPTAFPAQGTTSPQRLWAHNMALTRQRHVLNGLKLAIKYRCLQLSHSFHWPRYTQNASIVQQHSKTILHADDTQYPRRAQ